MAGRCTDKAHYFEAWIEGPAETRVADTPGYLDAIQKGQCECGQSLAQLARRGDGQTAYLILKFQDAPIIPEG